MRVALLYPPSCDPTAPYISLPVLAAPLRAAGHEVTLIDANVEAYDRILRPEHLAVLAARLERGLRRLESRPALSHREQLAYAALWSARGDASFAPGAIGDALAVLRDRGGERFYDPAAYDAAVATVESALRLISAAHHPLELSFAGYRTPFSLLSLAAVEADARAERNPFHDYFAGELCERLRQTGAALVGLSVAFPGQIQPAYALAGTLRSALPEVQLIAGGPALTQLLLALEPEQRERAIGPFHAAVLYEGEEAIVDLARVVERGEQVAGVLEGTRGRSLSDLPAPDFDGLPLDLYFSPEPVLPYDLSRGCYWGRCAFCHYGLTDRGTACYRERSVSSARSHLSALSQKHGARLFYLSQDSIAPRTILRLARELRAAGSELRWSTDLRPERFFDEERCQELTAGGALSVSLGVESASPRLLQLMDKGISEAEMRGTIVSLARAGVAAELMAFTGFPGETRDEALATLRFIEELRESVALFVCGEFALTRGSRVASEPWAYGVEEIWRVAGDELGTGLFYEEALPPKTEGDQLAVDAALAKLSRRWRLRSYPWAGALSTAHSMLWYARHGKDVFRGSAPRGRRRGGPWLTAGARFDVERVLQQSAEREAAIWTSLIYQRRRVSPAAYRALARAVPLARPRPRRWRYRAGTSPQPAPPGRTR